MRLGLKNDMFKSFTLVFFKKYFTLSKNYLKLVKAICPTIFIKYKKNCVIQNHM